MLIRILQCCVVLTLMPLVGGCAGPSSQQPQSVSKTQPNEGVPAASPALRLADHHEWVKRLLATPPVEAIQLISGNNGARTAFPVPLLPSVAQTGASYSLKVDRQAQLVWLQSHGYGGQIQRVDGPWKMDQPDAAHLLHSVTNPPTNLAPQQ